MTPERWKIVYELFESAVVLSKDDQKAFLDESCAHDSELRHEIESLLASAAEVRPSFLESPAIVALEGMSPGGQPDSGGPEPTRDSQRIALGTLLGPYRILAPLGVGGMGEVYKARDTRLDRDVAIKVLPSHLIASLDALARFEREAKAVAALSHPNILAVHDLGEAQGTRYAVMELLDGESLRQRLHRGSPSQRKIIEIARQIALGLAAAHEQGIVHRDLKPENIFLMKDGRVKILDFGLARRVSLPNLEDSTSATSQYTEPGLVLGTVGYMSPEQVRGQRVGPRSDIFSFGVVFHELLTAARPFRRESTIETMNAILKDDPEPLSQSGRPIYPGLERIVLHCLEKEPAERFQSAHDLAFALASFSNETLTLDAPAAIAKGRRVRLAPLTLFAALVVALAAGLTIGGVILHSSAQPPLFQRLTFRHGTIREARFAPDGQTIVYSAAWEGNTPELFTTRAGATESRALGIRPADLLAVSTLGEMALLLGPHDIGGPIVSGTLARDPLAGGAPRQMLESIESADWSPDGNQLAIVRQVGSRTRLEYPIGTVLADVPAPGAYLHPRVSPDGTRVAVIELADRLGPGTVVVIDRRGKTRIPTIRNPGGCAWSSESGELWCSGETARTQGGLFVVRPSGKAELAYSEPRSLSVQDVFRDGRFLVSICQSTSYGVMVRGPGDSADRELSWLDGSSFGVLSDDGTTLLFNETRETSGSKELIYVRPTDGNAAVQIGEGRAVDFTADGKAAIAIAPDGRGLSLIPLGTGEPRSVIYPAIDAFLGAWPFSDGKRLLVLGEEKGHSSRLYVGQLYGGILRPITPEGTGFYGVAIAPDGKLATGVGPAGVAMLYSIAGTEAPRPVPGMVPGDVPIRFEADGKALFVSRLDEVPAKVFRLDLTTGRREFRAELAPLDRSGVTSIRPIRMTPNGRYYTYTVARTLNDLFQVEGLR